MRGRFASVSFALAACSSPPPARPAPRVEPPRTAEQGNASPPGGEETSAAGGKTGASERGRLRARVESLRGEQDRLFASGEAPAAVVDRYPAVRGDAVGLYLRGRALAKSGRLEEAAFEFEASIAADPDFAYPCEGLGLIDLVEGRHPAALARLRRALVIDPSYANARYSLVLALAASGNLEGAKKEAERLLGEDDDPVRAPLWLAERALEEGRADEGITLLRGALGKAPGDVEARVLLARALAASGRRAEAVRETDRLLEAASPDPGVLYDLALLYRRAEKFDRALSLLEKVSASATPAFLARIPREALDSLLGEVREESASGRRRSVTVEELATTLRNDPDADRRLGALSTLAGVGQPELPRYLGEALRDASPLVRAFAARELGRRAPITSTRLLLEVLRSDSDATVRGAACEALGRNRAEEALPALVEAMGEPDAYVANAARRAAEAIAQRAFFVGDPTSLDAAARAEIARRAKEWLQSRAKGEPAGASGGRP